MRRTAMVLVASALGFVRVTPAEADGTPPVPAPSVEWQETVPGAFEAAKKQNKPIFIAINAEHVLGKSGLEPAALELREHTYRDAAVVAKSRLFVCVLVKPTGTSDDYGELRSRLGIQGVIVSPQHVFVHADGILISRKEYWPYGSGQGSVDALIAMMDTALAAHRGKAGLSAPGAGGTASEQRAEWIRERMDKIRAGAADKAGRDGAIVELAHGDVKGDCVSVLCAYLVEPKRDVEAAISIVRALGKPGLESAVAAVAQMLDDSSDLLRSNAAVTLEYVGSATAIEPLTTRLGKEHDEIARNNVCRALGHCGVKQEAVRKTLLREFATSKNNRASAGPAIGLSYFAGDAEAARGIEKTIATGVDWQKRALGLYALGQIGDPKSAEFVREKCLKPEKNQAALPFLTAVVTVLASEDKDGSAQRVMNKGIESAVGTLPDLGGPARANRDQSEFTPNGEIVPSRGRGR